ncbi:MAG: alkaline phosphatase family protein [Anaerolineales bacterium]|nr:alkaline phosphatase family protein [Anaerolineales bacterium]
MKSKLLPLLLALTILACQSPVLATPAATTPPASFTPTSTETLIPTAASTETLPPVPTLTPTPAPRATRVLILSIDGLRPDAISLAPMPNLLDLMQTSAYTLAAQTVYPSVTLISHASMLGGVCPSKHGITWNDYLPANGYANGTDLFDLAHANGLQTVMYVGKDKLRQLTEPSSLDTFVYVNDRDLVVTQRLLDDFPQDFGLLFVHFPLVDGMGHVYGWLSWQQLSVIRRADEALGLILAELDARNLREETLLIVTSDHGGHDTTHGSSLPEDMTIPWVVSGPGVQPGLLTTPVNTMDTAATAAYMLDLPIPPEWDGVPIYEAFGLPVERQSAGCE